MIDYTVNSLIADIKRHGSFPTSQNLLSDADLKDFLDHNQRIYLIPQIMRTREEFFVATFDIAIPAGSRTEATPFDLPTRAIGHKLRKVIAVDAQGNEAQLPRIEPENKTYHETFAWWPGTKSGYYFEGDQIFLTPNLASSFTTLRLKYYRRPNRLTVREDCAVITAINSVTGEITLDSVPSFCSVGAFADAVASKPTFRSHGDSLEISAVGVSSITLDPSKISALVVGDYICPEGETCVPQYPEELHPLLVQMALVDALKALGDAQGSADAASELEEMERSLNTLVKSRDDGSPRKLVSRRGIFNTGGV